MMICKHRHFTDVDRCCSECYEARIEQYKKALRELVYNGSGPEASNWYAGIKGDEDVTDIIGDLLNENT